MKMNKLLSRLLNLMMVFAMTVTPSLADEHDFFRAVVSGTTNDTTHAIATTNSYWLELVDDYLVFQLPSTWEAVPQEYPFLLCYRCTEKNVGTELSIAFVPEEEVSFESLQAICDEFTSFSCNVVKGSFEWQAYDTPGCVIVLHQGVNGKNYAIGLQYYGERPSVDSTAARDFYTIVSSLMLADEQIVSLWKAQQKSASAEKETLQFADPAFEAMLLDALGLPSDALITADMAEHISALFFRSGKLSLSGYYDLDYQPNDMPLSLADLKLFPNLTTLYVCDMELSNVEALNECIGLTDLSFIGCGLTSCDLFASCVNLEYLCLARNDIVSLEPLSAMPHLKELNLFCTAVEDLSPLTGMTELKELLISGSCVNSLEPLSGCVALENLYAEEINCNSLSLKPLGGLTHLTHVNFENTSVCDQEFISHVPNIKIGNWF